MARRGDAKRKGTVPVGLDAGLDAGHFILIGKSVDKVFSIPVIEERDYNEINLGGFREGEMVEKGRIGNFKEKVIVY